MEERLVAICFAYNPALLTKRKNESLIASALLRRIVDELKKFTKKKKNFDPSEFASKLPSELVEGYTNLVLKDVDGLNTRNEDAYKSEIELVRREIGVIDIRGKLEEAARVISELESAKKTKQLQQAKVEFGKLTKRLSRLETKEFKGIIF